MSYSTYRHEDDGGNIYISVSLSGSATVSTDGPDDEGPAAVREPLNPDDDPPSLAAQADPPRS